jgi:hypothetical protein
MVVKMPSALRPSMAASLFEFEIYVACEPVHIHVVSTGISWPHQEANMHPTQNQQLAIRAMLNTLIGPSEFDRLCDGMRVERIDDGILYVFVPNEDCAAKIEANYSDDLAAAAEQVFSQPIRIVNVLPMNFSSHQN